MEEPEAAAQWVSRILLRNGLPAKAGNSAGRTSGSKTANSFGNRNWSN
jgi:hypothetical protein